MAGETVRIQLGGHRQKPIRGWALVDQEDADLVAFEWSMTTKGYASRQTGPPGRKQTLWMHKVILERKLGRQVNRPSRTDHINRNPIDNRRKNLREVGPIGNGQNRDKPAHNTSGYRGVSWHRKHRKWYATVCLARRHYFCGLHPTAEAASRAVEAKRMALGFLTDEEASPTPV